MIDIHHERAAFRGPLCTFWAPLPDGKKSNYCYYFTVPFSDNGFAGCWEFTRWFFTGGSMALTMYGSEHKKEQLLAGTVSLVVKSNVHRSNPRVVKTGTVGQWLFFLYIL